MVFVIGIVKDHGENRVGVEFFNPDNILFEMGTQVKPAKPSLPVGQDDQNSVFSQEFAQISASPVGIQAVDAIIKPDFQSAECGGSLLFKGDFQDRMFGEDVTQGVPVFDCQAAEIIIEVRLFHFGLWFQAYPHHFGLPIGVFGKVEDFRSLGSFGQVVLLIPGNTGDGEPFGVVVSISAIPVDHVEDGPVVLSVEQAHMKDILTQECFGRDLGYQVGTILSECDDIINIRTLKQEGILFERSSDKSFLIVDIELLIGYHHFSSFYHIEAPDLGFSFPSLTESLF